MQRIIFIALLLLLIQPLFAQNETLPRFRVGANGGITYSSEKELKAFNQKVTSQLPFQVETLNNFPPNWNYGGYVLVLLGKWFYLGPSYQFFSTGSRIGYKDYSGTFTFDQLLTTNSLSIDLEASIFHVDHLELYIGTSCGVHLAFWTVSEYLRVSQQLITDNKYNYIAYKPFVYPNTSLFYPIGQHFGIGLKLGYSFDLAGEFKLKKQTWDKSEYTGSFTGPQGLFLFEFRF